MAVLTFEGFEFYSQLAAGAGLPMATRWTIAGNTSPVTFQVGRYGGRCLRFGNLTSTSANYTHSLGGSYASVAVGMAINCSSVGDWGGGEGFFGLNDSAGARQITFAITAAGEIAIYRNATLLTTSTGARPLLSGVWHYFECEVVINNTTGSLRAWIDETEIINVTGIDTQETANTNVAGIAICPTNALDTFFHIDDIYVTDGSKLGEQVVVPLRPNADTATKDFTPNAGTTNYTQVDEILTDSDTTFVQGSTVGQKDYYDLENAPSYLSDPKGVLGYIQARKTDTATRNVKMNLNSGGSVASSTDLVLAATYGTNTKMQLTDPNGGVDWTLSAINALQIGPEITV